MTEKIDFKKKFKEQYTASAKTPSVVEVPRLQYLMVDGKGDPNTEPWFQECTSALYGLSYTIKFSFKKGEWAGDFPDYSVPPLQGLWWAKDMIFDVNDKSSWHWRLMILQPDFVTQEHLEHAREVQRKKKSSGALEKVKLEDYEEGLCVQIMHIGPYSEEAPTIQKLHKFAFDNGYALRGVHHEIYLGDPRKSAPEKLKTILRQPVERVNE